MGGGIFKIIVGFIIGFLGGIIPVLGIPFIFIGVAIMIWGIFQFWFGAGKTVVKGVGKAAGVGSKKGTGRL